METLSIRPEDIELGQRHRALCEEAVNRLAASMSELGLRQPVSVRIVDEMMVDGELCAGVPILVAGAHRLAAAKQLGWSHVDCVEVAGDPISAELWELAENLHRLDLTREQRDEHIRRYAELLEARAKMGRADTFSEVGAGRGNKGIARQVADATGLSKAVVKRALNPAPPPEPKSVLDDHDVVTVQFNALVNAWNRAGAEARDMFRDHIEAPVFDNTRSGQ